MYAITTRASFSIASPRVMVAVLSPFKVTAVTVTPAAFAVKEKSAASGAPVTTWLRLSVRVAVPAVVLAELKVTGSESITISEDWLKSPAVPRVGNIKLAAFP